MNRPLLSLTGLIVVLPLAAGCTSRTAPFNEMDQAQITVLRLQENAPPPAPVATAPGLPQLIPGVDPTQLLQQGAAAVNQAVPGLIPPGLIPGVPAQPAQPVQQPTPPQFPTTAPPGAKTFAIMTTAPVTDDAIKNELLDIFGSESSFQADRGNCFSPGMGVAMQRAPQPNQAPQGPVEIMISLSCNQAMGTGFTWPYKVNGFTPEAHNRLTKIFEKFWGPVPPGV